jgi:translocation and assembly module TamB
VSGTASAPVLQLHTGVPDAGFGVPKLGIQVAGIKLEAVTHEDNRITLRGRAVSGKGEIRLDGSATLSEAAGWPVNLTIKGSRFLAADIPEAKVFVSPDLAVAFGQGGLMLTGKVAVPEAAIDVKPRTEAVRPSADVVLVGQEAAPASRPPRIETRVDVVLGDKVKVQAAGFTGRLDGRVRIEQSPKGPVLGTGQIMIREGRYSTFGVELDIHDGRILFAHSPVDNPGLDINVTRKTDDGLVGVKVLGTVQSPSANLYADRPMAQADILSVLVTGKPLGLASREEGSALQGAAASLGGSAGGFLAKEIGSRLGLSDFVDISVQSSLDAQGLSRGYRTAAAGGAPAGSAQSTALFLGKYLTPRLYVQYGMGLFQNAYVFRARYELTKNWKVQTETGEYSGGDILYQWEQ